MHPIILVVFSFFFNDTATTEIYTLSLHDALPILAKAPRSYGRHSPSTSASEPPPPGASRKPSATTAPAPQPGPPAAKARSLPHPPHREQAGRPGDRSRARSASSTP